jgi:putative methyltransferase (TIGR04325 family)
MSIRFTKKSILRAITHQSFMRNQETPLETPPVQTTGGCPAERECLPEGWSYAETHQVVRGWEVDGICDIYRQKWPEFVSMLEGPGPLGFHHESEDLRHDTDLYSHNLAMSYGYVLGLTARDKEKISILDFGGGIGHYYLLAKALLPGVDIDYHCRDLSKMTALGKELLPDQQFYDNDKCFDRKYDLVLAIGSLQYNKNWREVFTRLAGVTTRYLYIARLGVVSHADSFVFIQRPYQKGYNTEFLAWCLNSKDILDCAHESKLVLVREFDYGDCDPIPNAPENHRERGYLFTPQV